MALGPMMTQALKDYGLESLTEWASNALIFGKSEDQVMLELYERPEFRTRFAGMFAREDAGLPAISVQDYINYENVASSLGSTWGLNLSKSEVDNLIANNVSAQELEQRFTIASTAVYESDVNTRNELTRLFGIGDEQLMRYWMDPKAELGKLQQQYRMGEIAGAALRTGFGQLTSDQASRLQQSGITGQTAVQGFEQLAGMSELYTPLDEGEDVITTDTQIGALVGNATDAQTIEKRQQRRKAEFEGGGGFAAGQEGFATGSAD